MKPKLPKALLDKLRNSGKPAPWTCKLHLRRNRTVYAVEINDAGELVKASGRAIYSPSDIGFSPTVIEDVEIC